LTEKSVSEMTCKVLAAANNWCSDMLTEGSDKLCHLQVWTSGG